MLQHNRKRFSLKRMPSCEPLIDDNSQCILVAGGIGFATALLWGCIGWGSHCSRLARMTRSPANLGNPEVTQLHLAITVNEHIIRFDITVNDAVVMGILQG